MGKVIGHENKVTRSEKKVTRSEKNLLCVGKKLLCVEKDEISYLCGLKAWEKLLGVGKSY